MSTFDDDSNARLQGKRVALGVVIVIAVAFIGASAFQIIPSVFGLGGQGSPMPEGSPARECARLVRPLALAIDRASASAWSAHAIGATDTTTTSDSRALQAFRQGLLPEWNDESSVRQVCFESAGGTEAWAALVRLRSTQEQIMIRDSSELFPVRRGFADLLPADLR
jgi:hypothetical protein